MIEVLEPEACPSCGQHLPILADGRWRYSKGGKTFESIEAAESRIASLSRKDFEFAAVVDPEGRIRIASRRRRS